MKISLRTKEIEADDEFREHVQRRAAFALSRFGDDVKEVEVRLENVNGRRDGVDKRCSLVVRTRRQFDPIEIETVHEDASAAVDLSFGRAARTVARKLELHVASRARSGR